MRRVRSPAGQVGEDPRERQRVDRDRDGELRRLQPGGRAGDGARDRAHRPARDEQRDESSRPTSQEARRRPAATRRSCQAGVDESSVRACPCVPRGLHMLSLSTSIYARHVDNVNTCALRWGNGPIREPGRRRPARQRKRADRYHHGDLAGRSSQEALRTIQAQGVEAADAARRRADAGRLANRALPPFRRQVGAAGRGGAGGIPHAAARAARGVGEGRARTRRASRRWASPTCASPWRTRRTIA